HREYLNCMKQEFIKLMIHSWAALGTIINDFKKENEVLKHRADELYLEYKKRQHQEMVNSWAEYGKMVRQRLKMQAQQQIHKEYLNDVEKENEVLPHMAEMRANRDRVQPAQPTVSQTYTHNPYAVSDTVAPVEHPDAASNLELTQRPVCYRHDPYGFNGCWRKDL
nr:hypothetical protein [Candidatus Babeliales bacterium]